MRKIRLAIKLALGIILFLSLILAFSGFFLKDAFLKTETYENYIFTEEYNESVKLSVKDALNDLQSVIELPDGLYEKLDEADFLAFSRTYTLSIIDGILGRDSSANDENYTSKSLEDYIYEGVSLYAGEAEEDKLSSSETKKLADEATAYASAALNNALKYVPSYVLDTAESGSNKILPRLAFIYDARYFYVIIALICAACLIFGFSSDRIQKRIFYLSSYLWATFASLFLPVLLLIIYDMTANLELSKNTLYYLLAGCINAVEGVLGLWLGILFGLATAFLIYAIFAVTKPVGFTEDDGEDDIIIVIEE